MDLSGFVSKLFEQRSIDAAGLRPDAGFLQHHRDAAADVVTWLSGPMTGDHSLLTA
jgi:hypothetical protein